MSDQPDTEFMMAVDLAAAGETNLFIQLLNSDRPLDRNIRKMLADLVDELVQPPKKGRPKHASKYRETEQWRAVAEFDALLETGETKKRAVYASAKKWHVSESTLRSWIAEVRKTEKTMKAAGRPNWHLKDWGNLPKK